MFPSPSSRTRPRVPRSARTPTVQVEVVLVGCNPLVQTVVNQRKGPGLEPHGPKRREGGRLGVVTVLRSGLRDVRGPGTADHHTYPTRSVSLVLSSPPLPLNRTSPHHTLGGDPGRAVPETRTLGTVSEESRTTTFLRLMSYINGITDHYRPGRRPVTG